MKKLGGRVYGAPKPVRVPDKIWEIQEGVKLLVEGGVLDPKMMFLLVEPRGSYPVVLMHEDFSKLHGSAVLLDDVMAASKKSAKLVAETEKMLLRYDVAWLLSQDGEASIASNDEGILGTPAAMWLTTVLYNAGLKPFEDDYAWRLDFIEAIDPCTPVKLLEANVTLGSPAKLWAVVSEDKSKLHILFGKVTDVIKFKKDAESYFTKEE